MARPGATHNRGAQNAKYSPRKKKKMNGGLGPTRLNGPPHPGLSLPTNGYVSPSKILSPNFLPGKASRVLPQRNVPHRLLHVMLCLARIASPSHPETRHSADRLRATSPGNDNRRHLTWQRGSGLSIFLFFFWVSCSSVGWVLDPKFEYW